MPLTDKQHQIASPGKRWDTDGLYLNASPAGTRSWRFRCWLDGEEQGFTLGHYPPSLKDARARRDELRALVVRGIHPRDQADAERRADAQGAVRYRRGGGSRVDGATRRELGRVHH